jgi:hypothetical protein
MLPELMTHLHRLTGHSTSQLNDVNSKCLGFTVVLVSVAMSCACNGSATYRGDGKLIDNGPAAASERYILDLGPIDLGRSSSAKFTIAGLPSELFVAGLRYSPIEPVHANVDDVRNVQVSLEITDHLGHVALQVSGPLSTWTWSESRATDQKFIYGGYGANSSFKPDPKEAYLVTLSIVSSGTLGPSNASLTLLAGGWK